MLSEHSSAAPALAASFAFPVPFFLSLFLLSPLFRFPMLVELIVLYSLALYFSRFLHTDPSVVVSYSN
jgi:hypothetical protein